MGGKNPATQEKPGEKYQNGCNEEENTRKIKETIRKL
jgi:hypothetical protein